MLEKEEKLEKINEKMKAENSDLNAKLQSSTATLSHQKSMQEKSDQQLSALEIENKLLKSKLLSAQAELAIRDKKELQLMVLKDQIEQAQAMFQRSQQFIS